MYDTQHESFWFPGYPNDKQGNIAFNHGFSPKCAYTDVVFYPEHREDYSFGYVIPTALFQNAQIDPLQPSKAIRSTINQLIPRYGKVKSERCFGETHSPIQALQEKQGNCIHRTSLAAALAEVNNLPYQIVGSRNLLPEIHGTADLLTHFAPNYLIPRLSREPRQIRSFLCDLFINVIYGLTYPHWWLEVWENDRWATVDTVEWQPTSLPYFRENVEKRMVCKMGRIEQLSPQLK